MVKKILEFKSFIRIEKYSLKCYNLEENGLSTEDPKGIFPVKVKIKNSVN